MSIPNTDLEKLRRDFEVLSKKRGEMTYLAGNKYEVEANHAYARFAAANNSDPSRPYIMTGKN